MNNFNSKKLIYKYGCITGSFAIIFELMRFFLNIHYSNEGLNSIITLTILFIGILLGCLQIKKLNSGSISLNQTLKSGVGIALIYTILSLIYTTVLVNILEPTFWETAAEMSYEAAKAQDPDSMRNLSFEDFKPFVMWLSWAVYPISIAFSLFFGLIFSLVIGIVIKN